MAKKHKKKHDEEHVDESWLIPYADLLTLLLALFIVLFSMSSIDAKKFEQLARSFNSEFNGGTGVLDYPSPTPNEKMEQLNKQEEEDKKEEQSLDAKEKEELKEVQNKINEYIESKNLNMDLKTTLTDEGLLVTILNDIFFDSGKANIRQKDEHLAREISELLVMNPPRNIIISGHTDNIPINNAEFDSNWELSVMRAVNFMKIVIENDKLNSEHFSAKGFGEFKPVASNDTKEGRQKNRRVEVLILPNKVNGENPNQ